MARQLPSNPVKRRREHIKRILQHLEHFQSLMETGEMEFPGIVRLPDGEEIYLADLLVGIDTLPPRQRQAFEFICLKSFTESAATAIMLPHSRFTTPIQQYSDAALDRIIIAYDAKQAGTYVHKVYAKGKAKVSQA